MYQFIDLTVLKGEDVGMRYTIQEGAYRVFGRASQQFDTTTHLNMNGDRVLDQEQNQHICEILQKDQQKDSHKVVDKNPLNELRDYKRGTDILLDDHAISRTHAVIFVAENSITFADLMSTNGSKINNSTQLEAVLKDGDLIKIGNTVLELSIS